MPRTVVGGGAGGVVREDESGEPEGGFAETAVAGDRRMVAVLVAPLLAHPAGRGGILERVVEREHRDAEGVDPRVERPDRRLLTRPAVVPRQDVADRDGQVEREAALDERAQVPGGGVDGAALGEVVDPTLDDQHLRPRGGLLEAARDLVRPLAPDPVVSELELGPEEAGPVLPLPLRIAAPPPRVPVGRALGDRVAEARDDGTPHAVLVR